MILVYSLYYQEGVIEEQTVDIKVEQPDMHQMYLPPYFYRQ